MRVSCAGFAQGFLRLGEEIFFYHPNCCGTQEWKGLKYKQYIMITIAMTLRVWREVMGKWW